MRNLLPHVLVLSILIASVCSAETQNHRLEASSALELIEKSAPPDALYAEYNSIIETFSKAELLWQQNRHEDAENLFQLVLLKSSIYEKKIDSLPRVPLTQPVPVSNGPTAADKPSTTIPDHMPEPSLSPATAPTKKSTPVSSDDRSGNFSRTGH